MAVLFFIQSVDMVVNYTIMMINWTLFVLVLAVRIFKIVIAHIYSTFTLFDIFARHIICNKSQYPSVSIVNFRYFKRRNLPMQYDILISEFGAVATISVSKKTYRKNVIIKVLYECTDRLFVLVSEDNDNFLIKISAKDPSCTDVTELYKECGKLVNNLADQELRQIVIEETGKIRDVIIQKAFSEAAKGITNKLLDSDLPRYDQSYKSDKKNIMKIKG